MSGLINWWRSFGPDFEKDVLKILLDKGALALVVAFAGFVFARALERYKAAEARKTEITKLQFPLIQELIKDANNLAILAIETMEIELRRYEEWKPWLSNLEKANVIDIDLANNELPILQHKLSNGQLLRDHLLSCSPSHSINMALANYDFAQSEHFLRILTTWYYSTSFQRPLNDCMLQHQFLENVFWRLVQVTVPNTTNHFRCLA